MFPLQFVKDHSADVDSHKCQSRNTIKYIHWRALYEYRYMWHVEYLLYNVDRFKSEIVQVDIL